MEPVEAAAIAALRPEDSQIHLALGLVYDDLHEGPGPIAAYRRCIALRPELPEAQVNLGVALQEAGEFDAATDCYRAAISAGPDTVVREQSGVA
jgi:tetratricopeptide (TPR) repeat protein